MAFQLAPAAEEAIRTRIRSSAALAVIWGDYEATPRKTAVDLARSALTKAGLAPEDWDVEAVDWAKQVVDEALTAEGVEPRGTEFILMLEHTDGDVEAIGTPPGVAVGETIYGTVYADAPNPQPDTLVWQEEWADSPVPLRELEASLGDDEGTVELFPVDPAASDTPEPS